MSISSHSSVKKSCALPKGSFSVSISDEQGNPIHASVRIYGKDKSVWIPYHAAIPIWQGGFAFKSGPTRTDSYYLVNDFFFVDAGFNMELPEGHYKMTVSKGFEYVSETVEFDIKRGEKTDKKFFLRRWVDMPDLGWYSGDMHFHYERTDDEASSRLISWMKAQDVHVVQDLIVGDAKQLYFPQREFGRAGRYLDGEYAIASGQEDPRTNDFGHIVAWNIKKPVRDVEKYYFYVDTIREIVAQGGIVGFAHTARGDCNPHRMMALLAPSGYVSCYELCCCGKLNETDLYYDFLNLGFRFIATVESDTPWGILGRERVYVYAGNPFDMDAWYEGLASGRTFVSMGPMILFTVEGEMPGAEIKAKKGEKLKVSARALGHPTIALPKRLEIVCGGEVIKSSEDGQESIEVEFYLPVQESCWIAARCNKAHTTPVYIVVDGKRTWKLEKVDELIRKRLNALDEMKAVDRVAEPGCPTLADQAAYQEQKIGLRKRIETARKAYIKLMAEAEEQKRLQ